MIMQVKIKEVAMLKSIPQICNYLNVFAKKMMVSVLSASNAVHIPTDVLKEETTAMTNMNAPAVSAKHSIQSIQLNKY